MQITHTDIYRFSIPMNPFTIATGTMHYAQNIFIRVFTDEGFYGVGECSAFPMIVGETQSTCYEMAKEFAALWKGKDPLDIALRLQQLHDFTAFNPTIKSAFDIALYDIAAKKAGKPLYEYFGGSRKEMETDLTIGINTPVRMAATAIAYKKQGVRKIKIKLGKNGSEDVERVRLIREAVGESLSLRIDANQGWDYNTAASALTAMAPYHVEFCEQPMRAWFDYKLPALKKISPVPIMADESMFNHHDALRLIKADACSYLNIKFAKSGGIHEAIKIHAIAQEYDMPCMMGGMLESRIALSAFAHFAAAFEQVKYFDMDTCLIGHTLDPVTGGVTYNGYLVQLPETPGIGADAEENFLQSLEKTTV